MAVRKRRVPFTGPHPWEVWNNVNWPTDPSPGIISTGVNEPSQYLETTDSRGHAWPSAGRGVRDLGGNFTTTKIVSMTSDTSQPVRSVRASGQKYIGEQYPVTPLSAMNAAIASVTPSSDTLLASKGTTAIARCIPTNPVADAGTFIGELKEGMPKMIGKELFKTRLKDYRKVGSEYLNVQFGILPMLSDLQKFAKAAMESEKILKQLERDSGKNLRRKFTFPDEVSTVRSTFNNRAADCNGLSVYPYCFVNPGGGTLTTVTNTVTKTWFSGCFTYYLTLGDSSTEKFLRGAQEMRKLYGTEFSVETAWNLIPWSWLVDWDGNVGDVLHNVNRFQNDGLVMRYGYIMQEKTCKIDYTLSSQGSLKEETHSAGKELRLTVVAKSKVRRTATPFGFGFDMKALTGRQSAILGALGVSRGPNRL